MSILNVLLCLTFSVHNCLPPNMEVYGRHSKMTNSVFFGPSPEVLFHQKHVVEKLVTLQNIFNRCQFYCIPGSQGNVKVTEHCFL